MSNFLDNFSGTSGTNLTAHTSDSGNTYPTSLSTAAVLDGNGGCYNANSSSQPATYYTNWTASTNDTYTATIHLYSSLSTEFAGISARSSGSSQGAYTAYLFRANATNYTLYRAVNNGYTLLGTYATAPSSGDVLSMTCANLGGSSVVITCLVNSTAAISYTDSSGSAILTAGSFGLSIYGDGAAVATGMHMTQLTATQNTTLAAGQTSLTLTGTYAAPSVNITTTTATLGTSPYTYQFQRAPDVSGSPGSWSNIGSSGSSLTYSDTSGTLLSLYWYRVVVTDNASNTANSNAVQILYRVGTTYYFAAAGSDSNTGLTTGSPWQTLTKANSYGMVAGDTFAFKGGDSFSGTLTVTVPTGGYTPSLSLPLTVTSYGTGQGTISCGTGGGVVAVTLPYVRVTNLTITGAGVTYSGTSGASGQGSVTFTALAASGYGVYFHNSGTAQLAGCLVDNCTVTGTYIGIYINGNGQTTTAAYGYTAPSVTNCTVYNCVYMGIQTLNTSNTPPDPTDDWTTQVHTDVYLYTNNVYNIFGNATTGSGSGDNSGYSYYMASCNGLIMESCVGHDCGQACGNTGPGGGPCGVELANVANGYVRACEFYNISPGYSAIDATGIDYDGACTGCVSEFCYVHDCGGAAFQQGQSIGGSSGNTVRFCTAARCGLSVPTEGFFTVSSGGGGGALTIHNCVYVHTRVAYPMMGYSSMTANLYNNVLITYGTGVLFTFSNNTGLAAADVLAGNIYDAQNGATFSVRVNSVNYTSLAALQAAGYEVVNGLPVGVVGSSGLSSPVSAPSGGTLPTNPVGTLTNFDPGNGSAAINAGLDMYGLFGINPGEVDFHRYPCRYGASAARSGFDIGAVKSGASALLPSTGGGGGGSGILRLGL